jgi:hypothetical protein
VSHQYALRLVAAEGGEAGIVEPAVILHDVGWSQLEPEQIRVAFGVRTGGEEAERLNRIHEREGAVIARRILQSSPGCSRFFLDTQRRFPYTPPHLKQVLITITYIAEQNMVGAALGLAHRGKIPFVSTFAAFFSRAFDQSRTSQYFKPYLKFVGSHAGVSIGEDGPFQMGLEDIAMFREIIASG